MLRPEGTKAVDAAVVLARMLVPADAARLGRLADDGADSVMPHERLAGIDERLDLAAAKPVIIPETMVIDHGRVFLSETFLRACRTLGISVQPAAPTRRPTRPLERTFSSINTLFCQHVAGYTGRDVTRRGATSPAEAVWTLAELQELLDEWVMLLAVPAARGPAHPLRPDRGLSPNEAYAALVAAAGYVPVALTGRGLHRAAARGLATIDDYGI